jgi:hypothetical protein
MSTGGTTKPNSVTNNELGFLFFYFFIIFDVRQPP